MFDVRNRLNTRVEEALFFLTTNRHTGPKVVASKYGPRGDMVAVPMYVNMRACKLCL